MTKLKTLFEKNEENRKRKHHLFHNELGNLFDIMTKIGEWLFLEDKELYDVQIGSNSKISYVINKHTKKIEKIKYYLIQHFSFWRDSCSKQLIRRFNNYRYKVSIRRNYGQSEISNLHKIQLK